MMRMAALAVQQPVENQQPLSRPRQLFSEEPRATSCEVTSQAVVFSSSLRRAIANTPMTLPESFGPRGSDQRWSTSSLVPYGPAPLKRTARQALDDSDIVHSSSRPTPVSAEEVTDLKNYFLQEMNTIRNHHQELRVASHAALEMERSRTSQLEVRAQESELAIQQHYRAAIQTEHGRLLNFEQAIHHQESQVRNALMHRSQEVDQMHQPRWNQERSHFEAESNAFVTAHHQRLCQVESVAHDVFDKQRKECEAMRLQAEAALQQQNAVIGDLNRNLELAQTRASQTENTTSTSSASLSSLASRVDGIEKNLLCAKDRYFEEQRKGDARETKTNEEFNRLASDGSVVLAEIDAINDTLKETKKALETLQKLLPSGRSHRLGAKSTGRPVAEQFFIAEDEENDDDSSSSSDDSSNAS